MRTAAAVILALAAMAAAQDDGGWQGSASLGGLFTSGNTEASQIDAGLELTRSLNGESLTGELAATASYGSQEEETYREAYLTEAGLRWNITEVTYSRLAGYWTRDEISGISDEYGASVGLGRSLLSRGGFEAGLETGAGLLRRTSTADSVLKTSTGYLQMELAWSNDGAWSLTQDAKLTNDFQDSENWSLSSASEASSAIAGNLSFLIGFDVIHRNLPAVVGSEKTDTALRLQLRLGF
jgi:putative salt-induced outer membrane protein YdiY